MSQFFRTRLGYALTILCLTILSVVVTKATYDHLHLKQNIAFLDNLSERLLHRAELSADYAIIALSDADLAGHTNCSSESVSALAMKLYSRGDIKDFAILDSRMGVQCTILGASSIIPNDISKIRRFDTQHTQIQFFDTGEALNGIMGINWQFDDYGVMALTNIDTLLFHIFPPELRDYSIAQIGFDNHNIVGNRDSLMIGGFDHPDVVSATKTSTRYPLSVKLGVDFQTLETFNDDNKWSFLGGGAITGFIFGLLIAQLLSRPIDPVAEIKQGIANDEFIPFVQPLFDLKSRKIVGGEVLVRWQKPCGDIIPPVRFIDLAEDNGLTKSMTRSLIRQALAKLGPVMANDRTMKIAFNVTPTDLTSEDYPRDLINLVKNSHVRPNQIVLEITERQGIMDTDHMNQVIGNLKELGFRVSLDDTGTGHNGLSYVQDLNADILKIDKKFVDFITQDGGDHIVRLLVQLAQRMKMQTVAEGIETEDQAQILSQMGVDHGQGYLVSKPLPIDQFSAAVDRQNRKTVDLVA